jgi:ferric-dicitrate binding protein FerR (iron transport regulator)
MDADSPETIDEAAKWFAASRRGVMTLDERQAYELWRNQPANAAAMRRFTNVWDMLDGVSGPRVERQPAGRNAPGLEKRVVARSALIAATFVAILLGAGSLPQLGPSSSWTELDWWSR